MTDTHVQQRYTMKNVPGGRGWSHNEQNKKIREILTMKDQPISYASRRTCSSMQKELVDFHLHGRLIFSRGGSSATTKNMP
jgi:hypothetical protein